MKVILATIHLEESTRSIPLAAACLKAVVQDHEVRLRNYSLDQSAEEIVQDLTCDLPDVLGFPVYLWNRTLVINVISLFRKKAPHIPILAGGPEVTAAPSSFLEDSGVDCAMQGEGEVMINPVLDALSKQKPIPGLPGIWTVDHTPDKPAYCEDINSLESPILSGALDLNANEGLLWELSRGCPFACEFCFESKGCGKVRYFSLERVKKELEMIKESGVRQVFVLDPTFNVNKKRVLTILNWIAELAPEVYFYFEVRTEFLDEESAAAFSAIPCTLQIGLQSSDPLVLKNINRNLDPETFREKVQLLGNAGVSFGLDLIYGLPGDTLKGFKESLNYALSLEPNHLDIFPLAVLPGTVLFDRKGVLKIHSDEYDPYLVLETEEFSASDMMTGSFMSRGTDLLYNRGRGISWFSRVCYDLDLEPVDIIDKWMNFNEGRPQKDQEIPVFLEFLYRERNQPGLFPVLKDLFKYLDLLEELEQMAIPEIGAGHHPLRENDIIRLDESVRLSDFVIPPDLILEGFPASSEELMAESGYFPVILWVRSQGVCMDILDQGELKILQALGSRPMGLKDLKKHFQTVNLREVLMNGLGEGYLRQV